MKPHNGKPKMWALQLAVSTNSLIGPAGLSDVGRQKQIIVELHNTLFELGNSACLQAVLLTPIAAFQTCSGLCPVKSQPDSV